MHIGLVSPYDMAIPGGANHHIVSLAAQLRDHGHTVKIIGPTSKTPDYLEGTEFIEIGKPYPVPANASIARIAISLRLAGPVKVVLEREKFDLVHLHEPLQGPLPLMVLRHATCVKIGTFHAFSDSRLSTGSLAYYYAQRLLKRWFRMLDGKIAVSEAAAEYVSKFFPGYYNIIPNGIDYDYFAADHPPLEQFRDDKKNILFVGRLEQRKGLRFLLRAFREVKVTHPNTRLIVVGAGDRMREAYEAWVAQARVPDVHFAGFVPHEDLVRYYQSADVFCAPNTGDESFGIVLLEAMAARKPIVATNIRGFAGVMTDGVEGLLVTPKNENALAVGLNRVLSNPKLASEFAENGRIKAREFSWEPVTRRVISYYERILLEVQSGKSQHKGSRRGLRGLSAFAPYMGLRR